MSDDRQQIWESRLSEKLTRSGLRFTSQRQRVYKTLMERKDHPTAEQVFLRVKQEMPDISMATVYNCLDALVKCGLVNEVNLERTATRFCPNMEKHGHFYCDECGTVYDIDLAENAMGNGNGVPNGFTVKQLDVSWRGLCPTCCR